MWSQKSFQSQPIWELHPILAKTKKKSRQKLVQFSHSLKMFSNLFQHHLHAGSTRSIRHAQPYVQETTVLITSMTLNALQAELEQYYHAIQSVNVNLVTSETQMVRASLVLSAVSYCFSVNTMVFRSRVKASYTEFLHVAPIVTSHHSLKNTLVIRVKYMAYCLTRLEPQ